MATRVIYGEASDALIQSRSTTSYSDAREAGAGSTVTAGSSTSTNFAMDLSGVSTGIGQRAVGSAPTNYGCHQGFIAFNTAGLGSVSSATLSMYLSTNPTGTSWTCEVRVHDWGSSVEAGDYVVGTSLSGLTEVASLVMNLLTGGQYHNFSDVAMASNLNLSGFSRFILHSSRQRTGSAPSSSSREDAFFNSADSTTPPKLTIVDDTTQGSQTLTGGTTSFTPTVTGMHDLDLWGGGCRPALGSSQEGGGGGGAFSYAVYDVTSLSNVNCSVAASQTTADTAGNDSWFGSSSSPDPLAKGGGVANRQEAGSSTNSRGLVKFAGGAGAAAQGGGGSRGGSGGGGGGGSSGNGQAGSAGSGSDGGAGGTGGTPSGGAGGTGTGAGKDGGDSSGRGGGGGGGGGTRSTGNDAGGNGGIPGGGAGGGSSAGDAGNGAAGKIIVYWYVPAETGSTVTANYGNRAYLFG